MLFKGNSSKLELLIEKIQANKENGQESETGSVASEEVSVGGSSWDVGSDGRGSLSPASSATPTSASETDVEAAATVGVTQTTPYQCSFCDRAFPRLSYLKRHEQLHGLKPETWSPVAACSALHADSAATAFSSPFLLSHTWKFDISMEENFSKDSFNCEPVFEKDELACEKYSINDVKINSHDSVTRHNKLNCNAYQENSSKKRTLNPNNTLDFHGVKSLKQSYCGKPSRKESLKQMGNPISKKWLALSDSAVLGKNCGSLNSIQCFSLEKSSLESHMHGNVTVFGTNISPDSEQYQSEGRSTPNQSCNENSTSDSLERDLKQSRWQLSRKELDAPASRHRVHNDRLVGSVNLPQKLPRDVELCTTEISNDSKTSNMYLNDKGNVNEVIKDYELLTKENYTNKSYTNVWLHDEVFNYIEKELKNMEGNHNAVKRNQISEEVFHFIEMESKQLESEASHSSNFTHEKLSGCEEMLRTPEAKTSSSLVFREKEQVYLDCGNKNDSRFNCCIYSSGDEECSMSFKERVTEQTSIENGEKNGNSNEKMLCQRHLDQPPTNLKHCKANLRKTSTNINKYMYITSSPKLEMLTVNKCVNCESQTLQALRTCSSNASTAEDNDLMELDNSIFNDLYSRKIFRTTKQQHRLNQNKSKRKNRTCKGRKSKNNKKYIAYKMSNGKISKTNIFQKTKKQRPFSLGSYNAYYPISQSEWSMKPFLKVDNVLHDVMSNSQSDKSEIFSKETGKAVFTSTWRCKSPSSVLGSYLFPETSRYNQSSRFIQLCNSGSRQFQVGTWDKKIPKKSSGNEIDSMEISQIEIKNSHCLLSINPFMYSISNLQKNLWTYPLSASKNNLPKSANCDQNCQPEHPRVTLAIPWQHLYFSMLPSSDINTIYSVHSVLHGDSSPWLPSVSKPKFSLVFPSSSKYSCTSHSSFGNRIKCLTSSRSTNLPDCSVCAKGLTSQQNPEDFPKRNVINDHVKYENNCITVKTLGTESNTGHNVSSKKTTADELNSERNVREIKFQTTRAQRMTQSEEICDTVAKPISIPISTRTRGNTKRTENLEGLLCKLDDIPNEQMTNIQRLVQVRTHPFAEECKPNVFVIKVCGQEYPFTNEALKPSTNICTNMIDDVSFPASSVLKFEYSKLSSSQSGCKCEMSSFSLDHKLNSITQEVTCMNKSEFSCLKQHKAVNDNIPANTVKNQNHDSVSNEKEQNLAEDKVNTLVLASKHYNLIPLVRTEVQGGNNKESTLGTDTVKTLSSIVMKEASKWKVQMYHPYILPKKRQLGMFRIAKIQELDNKDEMLINLSPYFDISESAVSNKNEDDYLSERLSFNKYENCYNKKLNVAYSDIKCFRGNEIMKGVYPFAQSLKHCQLGTIELSELESQRENEIGMRIDRQTKDADQDTVKMLFQDIIEVEKSTVKLAAPKEETSVKDPLINQCNMNKLLVSPNFIPVQSKKESSLSGLQEFGKKSVEPQGFLRKSSLVRESSWLEKVSKNESCSFKNTDNLTLTKIETIPGSLCNQQKQHTLMPTESIWSGTSQSESRSIDNLSPSSVVKQGAHFKIIHKIAPCILRPNHCKGQSPRDCVQRRASKRKPKSFFVRHISQRKQKLNDTCSSFSQLMLNDSVQYIDLVSLPYKKELLPLSNPDDPPIKIINVKNQGISDVSLSDDEEPAVLPNFFDISRNYVPNNNITINNMKDIQYGTNTADTDESFIVSESSVSVTGNPPPPPPPALPESCTFITAMTNSLKIRDNFDGCKHTNVMQGKVNHIQSTNVFSIKDEGIVGREQNLQNEDLFSEFERQSEPAFQETDQMPFDHFSSGLQNNLSVVIAKEIAKGDGGQNLNWLSSSELTPNTTNNSLIYKTFTSQEHVYPRKDIKKKKISRSSDIEENDMTSLSQKNCALEYSENNYCNTSSMNNFYNKKRKFQTEESLKTDKIKFEDRELLNKLQPENIVNPLDCKSSPILTVSSEAQFGSLTFTKNTEEQDILDIALRTDLYDVITLGSGTMYTWPQIEESAEHVPSAQHTSSPDKREAMANTDVFGNLNFEEKEKLYFQEPTNGVSTHESRVTSHESNAGVAVLDMLDECSKSVGSTYILSDSNSSEFLNTCSTHSGSATEDETEGLKDERENSSTSSLDSLTHADQLPFRCEFCGRLFKHKRSRDRHVKLHTGDKKYKCCHCEAAFSRSDHLKIHKKTHDTQKPYQCSVCNRGYNTAAALTAHMQNHKAKLTAHALNQLLKDAQGPGETHTLTQLLRDTSGDVHSQALNHLLKDTQKEQLLSPRGIELGAGSSPGDLTASPVGEPSPTISPLATVRCPICHAHCRNQAHLQRHLSRYHGDEIHAVSAERPASCGGGSGASSIGGASSAASTPSPRPPSSLPSPRPLPNPLLSLVSGKLSCLYCSRDGFPSLEALQLHLQSAHGSVLNGEVRDMAAMLGLPSSLGTSLGASGLASSIASPLGPGSSRGVSCELCGARVGGVTALQRHVVTAHTFTDLLARAAEGVFCAQCLLPFSNPGALAEHIKLVHAAPVLSAVLNKRPPSPPTDTPTDLSKKSRHETLTSDLPASTLLCSQCNAPFTNFEAFRRHLKSHLDGGEQLASTAGAVQLACPECRLPLTSEAALEAHLSTHLGVTCTEYGCQACLKLFSKPDELQKHLMDIHAHHLYRCALCKEMFDSKVSIQVHFAVKHSNECKVSKCTRCSLIFRSHSEFEGHIRSSHVRRGHSGSDQISGSGSGGGSGGSYRCLLCTLTLSSEAELSAHVATHQRQFQCSLCDDAFYVEFLLDKHMQTQHNSELNGNVPQPENLAKPRRSPQKKELRCDICDAEFSTDSGLQTHRKQAHNIKSGSGGIAAKVAAASLSLFCAYCSEACKSRGDLEAHMKSHQGNGGRHKCNICDELCPSAALLAQHKLTHVKVVSGSACAVCREPLTSEQQFTNHQNEHHPAPLPQPCVVCRQTLVTDMEVNVHARFHAAQAAQAAAAASVASSIFSSGELLHQSSNSSLVTTAATVSTITTNSSSSHSSSSPRHSPSLRCSECHLKLETIEEAEVHAASHHHQNHQPPQHQGFGRSVTSRTYQCIKCQESFASEAEIEAHVASHLLHEGSVHECHLCRATFDTPLRLQCHLIEHTFEGCGSFTCYMCSSVFTTASRLQQHMVEHGLSARPYDCHHCHQRFFFRAELENHALSHPEAADGCRECHASFPDLPRRNLRLSSLSCITSAQHVGPPMIQTQGNSEMGLTRPASPCTVCTGDERDAGSANGHGTSATDIKDE